MKCYFILLYCLLSSVLYANTKIQNVPMPNLKKSQTSGILYKNIVLQFGKNPKRAVLKQQGIVASKVSHNIFKNSTYICTMLFFSALKDLQTQALRIGGSYVGNIESYIDGKSSSITKHFKCENGLFFSVVTLRADVR